MKRVEVIFHINSAFAKCEKNVFSGMHFFALVRFMIAQKILAKAGCTEEINHNPCDHIGHEQQQTINKKH
jgi:hypothetical protein